MPQLKYWDGTQYVPILGGIDQATADARYVKKTGDTMSGWLLSDQPSGGKFEVKSTSLRMHMYTEEANGKSFLTSMARSAPTPMPMELQASEVFVQYGTVRLSRDPTAAMEAVTKQYVDTGASSTVPYASGWGDYDGSRKMRVVTSGPLLILYGLIKRTGSNLAVVAGSTYQVGTAPTGFRPVATADCWASHAHSTNPDGSGGRVSFNSNGSIYLVPHYDSTINTGNWVTFNGAFLLP